LTRRRFERSLATARRFFGGGRKRVAFVETVAPSVSFERSKEAGGLSVCLVAFFTPFYFSSLLLRFPFFHFSSLFLYSPSFYFSSLPFLFFLS